MRPGAARPEPARRDGITVCRELRARSEHLRIIAVTARGEERDRVAGLRTGADDYVVKLAAATGIPAPSLRPVKVADALAR